jgi:hypothetical protein
MHRIISAIALLVCACAVPRPAPTPDPRSTLRAELRGKERAQRLKILHAALDSRDPAVRAAAARILGSEFVLEGPELKPLIVALDDIDPRVEVEAARALLVNLPAAEMLPPAKAGARDPFRAGAEQNRRNIERATALRKAIDARLRLAPEPLGPPLPGNPIRLLDRTTIGPNVPVYEGSQAIPR